MRIILLLAFQQQVIIVAILLGLLGHRDRRSVKQRSGLAATCWIGSLVKLHRRLLLGAAQVLVYIRFVCPREAKLSCIFVGNADFVAVQALKERRSRTLLNVIVEVDAGECRFGEVVSWLLTKVTELEGHSGRGYNIIATSIIVGFCRLERLKLLLVEQAIHLVIIFEVDLSLVTWFFKQANCVSFYFNYNLSYPSSQSF